MKIIVISTVFLAIFIDKYDAKPTNDASKNNTIESKDNNSNIDDSDVIDISGLGPKAFGEPSKETGETLASWSESSLVNPEEMGDYFEGDILMPPVLLRNGLLNLSYHWPNAIVPYEFEGNFSKEERDLILKAMNQFHNYTCIRFVPSTGQEDYLALVNDGTGCSSAIGKLGGHQTINLAPECLKIGTIMHELMHTLGFFHEVSRQDRDQYITVRAENIAEENMENFKAYQSNTFGVDYDYGSIMHQSEYAFAKKSNKKTIEAKRNEKGALLGQRSRLSQGDIEKINSMYKCQM